MCDGYRYARRIRREPQRVDGVSFLQVGPWAIAVRREREPGILARALRGDPDLRLELAGERARVSAADATRSTALVRHRSGRVLVFRSLRSAQDAAREVELGAAAARWIGVRIEVVEHAAIATPRWGGTRCLVLRWVEVPRRVAEGADAAPDVA